MKTKLTILIMILIFASLFAASTLYSGADDKSDRLSSDQSSVFSPGYINAAMQKTQAIVNQVNGKSNNNRKEENAEYMDNKLSNDVREDAAQRVNPELKKKTGGGEPNQNRASASSAQSITIPAPDNNPQDVSAYIRQKAEEYIAGNGGDVSSCQIKYADGKYQAFWNYVYENDGNWHFNKALLTQTFDSGGNVLNQNGPATLMDMRMSDAPDGYSDWNSIRYNTSVFGNGNIMVSWNDTDSRSINAKIFNSGGDILRDTFTITGTQSLNGASVSNISSLANGNIAVFWDETDSNNKGFIKTQILDSGGNALLGHDTPFTLTGDQPLNWYASIRSVSALANGGMAVVWYECDSNYRSFLKAQTFNSNGNAIYGTTLAGDSRPFYGLASNITTLDNGGIAVSWGERDLNNNNYVGIQIFDSNGRASYSAPISITGLKQSDYILNVSSFANGNTAVVFLNDETNILKTQVFDSRGNALFAKPVTVNADDTGSYIVDVSKTVALANGDIAVFWLAQGPDCNVSMKTQRFDSRGNALYAELVTVCGYFEDGNQGAYINDVSVLANGDIAVFSTVDYGWGEWGFMPSTYSESHVLDRSGNFVSKDVLNPDYQNAFLNSIGRNAFPDPYSSSFRTDNIDSRSAYMSSEISSVMDSKEASGIFKVLLADKGTLLQAKADDASGESFRTAVMDSLKGSALAMPAGEFNQAELDIALRLANILKNPTEDQKEILSAVESLLNAVNSLEDAQAQSPELKKASDDFLRTVAAILISQAIPDLLKEGDVANIKIIFAELNTEKTKIVLEYQESVRPYYEEIARELSKNMNALQLKNILSKSMIREDLEKLPPNELDKILEKLRQAKEKSFEAEYILQQEAKYRKAYLDPSKKMLDARMKDLLESFTKKLSGVLEGVKKEEKK